MLQISSHALHDGCERAQDLFTLSRLRPHEEAAPRFDAVYDALGVDGAMREHLQRALLKIVPTEGLTVLEEAAASAMAAGVLVGLLIADSALPAEELDLPVIPTS